MIASLKGDEKLLHQGDIIWLDLEPAVGNEVKKRRPCLIVSNDSYNRYFNTVITVPISRSRKYLKKRKYIRSPNYVQIKQLKVQGTALLQQARAVDPKKRNASKVEASISVLEMKKIRKAISKFY